MSLIVIKQIISIIIEKLINLVYGVTMSWQTTNSFYKKSVEKYDKTMYVWLIFARDNVILQLGTFSCWVSTSNPT